MGSDRVGREDQEGRKPMIGALILPTRRRTGFEKATNPAGAYEKEKGFPYTHIVC
jgi:hypothetical protein